jgi:hypothetical protein
MDSPAESQHLLETDELCSARDKSRISITIELGKIIKAIGKCRSQERIFDEHCNRSGKLMIPESQLTTKNYKNGYTTIWVNW